MNAIPCACDPETGATCMLHFDIDGCTLGMKSDDFWKAIATLAGHVIPEDREEGVSESIPPQG